MIDAILYIADTTTFDEDDTIPQGATKTNGNQALIYWRGKTLPDDERITVLASDDYTGTGTADRLYEYIQQRGELNALYHEVCPLKQLYWTDPETGDVDYDAAMGTEFVRFGMLAESPLPVPKEVTARQARLALAAAGLLSDVERALGDIADPMQRQAATIEWQYASTIERDAEWLQYMAASLGLTGDQVDALFIKAAAL